MDVEHQKAPAMRVSDVERDEVLVRLHTAFAEGRLSDRELDERTASVLAARTRPELDHLLVDLPVAAAPGAAATKSASPTSRPGRLQVAYKSSVRRGGSWRLPDGYTTVIYKGGCLLDLRAAELEDDVITIRAIAYKSDVEIIVPAGVRVEVGGFGVSSEIYGDAVPGAPVVQIRGFAYKGEIDVHS
ncbi:DUF1707 domain-containing protein [Actinomadura sp. HBU206391]|uniref:DUF1707 SHOCT-like domain-containing protein n=1 Tax=Actinomadura sp. HBU206391 TaxID=2731692 RepID=UPI00164F9CCC|nr:DUF1707 domain-containing protein [Actinomadura sp. HBU206391]MBC6458339.1 DUF1707 domain-containing protein [Actinomadura sp. HBU206391]